MENVRGRIELVRANVVDCMEDMNAYIDGILVTPSRQGRGIGREAMARVLEELKNIPTIDLVTHPDNAHAIQLYESLGFIIGERMENHFGDGEPRIAMTFKR